MDQQQTRLGRLVKAITPSSPSTVVKAVSAFLIVLILRVLLGSTLFAKILIAFFAGDLQAEQLPFPYLVVSFVMLLGLLELVSLMFRFYCRYSYHVIIGIANAIFLAFLYRFIL